MAKALTALSDRINRAYRFSRLEESFIKFLFLLISSISILTTLGIIVTIIAESGLFFSHVSFREFFMGREWTPLFEPKQFGVLPILWGTIMVAVGACAVALPLGVGVALYLSEYASPRMRAFLKPIIELLAGIPSVVFGYFAVTVVTPFLQTMLPTTEVFNAASAALMVAVMILPLVASISDDAFRSVPQSMRDAGYALGATPLEVNMKITIRCAASGIMASLILAFARAIGETMAVSLAAGSTPNLTLNFLEPIQTMTGFIVQVSMGDVEHGTIEYQSLFAVAGLLFVITMIVNYFARRIVAKMREVYE